MTNNEIETMKQFIYEKTSETFFENEIILNYLKAHDISHSKNNNGIFINISLLEDKKIILLYKLIKININNDFQENDLNLKQDIISFHPNKMEKQIKKKKKPLKSFKLNKLQVNLLSTIFKPT
tara:strand:+ start:868 stop:1236 length:369 start_codon:yes stop_codon:yes gene_type:complete